MSGGHMFHYLHKVQYHETDKMSIAHHSNYVKWMEEARVAFLEEKGLPFQVIEATGVLSPVVEIEVKYKQPCEFADVVDVGCKLVRFTKVRYEIEYVIVNETRGYTAALGRSLHCFTKDGKPCSLKLAGDEIFEKFSSLVSQ